MSSSLLSHIRGAQPSKRGAKQQQPKIKSFTTTPRLTGLQKNIQNVLTTRKKASVNTPSYESNNIMDQRCFRFFMDHFVNARTQTRIPINTQECNNLFSKHDIEFVTERTQELSNAKVLITTKTTRKKNNATFVIKLPMDYCEMLVCLLLIKIDFGSMQIEFSQPVGRTILKFLEKSKASGFRYYFDFIRVNILNNRFIVIRSQ